MPAYNYIAINDKGIEKKGILSASSERDARKLIKSLNLTPVTIKKSSNVRNKARVKNKDIVVMTRQLSTLLEANTPIVKAIDIVANQLRNKELIYAMLNIKEDIVQGIRLSDSMKKYPNIFSETYVSMVSAGDASGNLQLVFSKLASYLEESANIRQKVISAMTYPLVLISFSILVIIALLIFVLPNVINQFAKAGVDLPLLTQILLGVSNNIFTIAFISFSLFFLTYLIYKNYIKDLKNKIKLHKKIIKTPFIGNFILNVELEKFSTTMELLVSSGTNLDNALKEASKTFNNKFLTQSILDTKNDVIEGKDFIISLSQHNLFPDVFIQLISSGYKSGNLVEMFNKVSDYMKNEIENKRNIFLSLLEPLVIIFMGGFILLIVLAILIPIMQMNTLAL
ncbi:MAG: type II secretion system protein F [Gammaproteobacteria bacterium]|nr:type II secretion system protein F [Gammaproteobacteria bacterium]